MPKSARWPVAAAFLAGSVIVSHYAGGSHVLGQAPTEGPAIPRELTSYRDLVKRALPAVVSIEAKGRSVRPTFFPGRQESEPRENTLGAGSGVVVDGTGVIVTNNHVVDGAETLEVTFTDGKKFTSKDFKRDANTDLAVVRIKADTPLPSLPFGDSSQMEIGDRVLAIGAPFGLRGTVTHGIISAKGRDLQLNRYDDFLQTDAAINPGNSGGPLINLAGQVIGINSAIKTTGLSGGFQGVGLAIPSNMAKKVMGQLLKDGEVKRGYFGVNMYEDPAPEVMELLGARKGGAVMSFVVPNSPAAKAGMQADDVVTMIGTQTIRDHRELMRYVGEMSPGESVDVEVIRDSKPTKLTLTIGTLPSGGESIERARFRESEESERVAVKKAGMALLDAKNRRGETGAMVAAVTPNGLAANAGMQPGMTIVRVNRKPIANAEEAKSAIEAADSAAGVLLHLQFVSPTKGGVSRMVLLKGAK